MVQSVTYAFSLFRENIVDIQPNDTKKGRASRTYLCAQLEALESKVSGFPRLKGDCVPFGSFSRRTKVHPLNDIDLLLILSERGVRYRKRPNMPYTYRVTPTSDKVPLAAFLASGGYVDSNKVLLKLKGSLKEVAHYTKAERHKKHNALALKLLSYSWVFDIVPALAVTNDKGTIQHYLIPDGKGDWIRTNPRIDQRYITRLNNAHNQMLIPVVRMLKYWNHRRHKPRLESYYFETLVLRTFEGAPPFESYPEAIAYFFQHYARTLREPCPDPKELGPNLDASVDRTTKVQVGKAMKAAGEYAKQALAANKAGRNKVAFQCWRRVFGKEFPSYG